MKVRVPTDGTNGNAVPGWTTHSGSGGAGTAAIQSKKIALTTANVAGTTASVGILSGLQVPYDFDITFRATPAVAWSSATAFALFIGDAFTAEGGRAINNGMRFLQLGDGFHAIVSYVGGAQQSQVSTTFTPTGTTPVRHRFQRKAGQYRSKCWNDGTNEPAWLLDLDEFSAATPSVGVFPTLGPWRVGLAVVGAGATVAARRIDFDDIVIDDLQPVGMQRNFRRMAR